MTVEIHFNLLVVCGIHMLIKYTYMNPNINIQYHLILGLPPLHRQFFMKLLKNRDYIQTHCNDRRNPFQFACHQWFSYKNHRILT